MISEIENEEIRAIPQEKYNLVVWTPHEKLFRNRVTLRNTVLSEIAVPFTIALQVKLRRSVFGTYLDDFNENQCQNEFLNTNKLSIMESVMRDFNSRQENLFDYNNNLFDHVIRYLNNTVTETKQIDCDFLYEHATHLRMDDYHINMVDDGVRNFRNLQVLVICGNWIQDIDGSVLPRRLKFLELYVNEIESLDNLTHKPPKHLLHLGLARNKLTNDSHLHLLAACRRFNNLKSLDLSECDIYRLVDVLHELKPLQNLEGLLLQGNPCSMVMGYKDMVLDSFPYLIFLDGIEISRTDQILTENFLERAHVSEFILHCPKLTGLPKPPKLPKADKKVKQTIHIEFKMPLFQLNIKEDLDKESEKDLVRNKSKERKKGKKGHKDKKSKSGKSTKKGSKKGGKSPYERPNEYNPKKINNAFQSQRKAWGNNLKFTPLVLQSPENNLLTYRDTFRSCVNVSVIYLQYKPPEKKKKKKKG
nr:PREDICTED: uncharacterized protein LOC103312973 [Tribolium castaneum]|eukprot:XP_015835229.1 PREDICTED: uncharacterized protein LOC103312973 [Tribolium castaneum]